ncbi:MAG TPA: hypothetical protein VI603_19005, partial [Saprospiraceae bacterium]|nr:hypothetical protein [Saprospiraceae bacterium]
GRWWQVDPAAESMYGYNPFNAMGDNPISYNDPEGDFIPALLIGAAIGAAIGIAANGIGNLARGDSFFKGGFQAGFFGAMGGMFSAGVGGAFNSLATSLGKESLTIGMSIAQAGFHGINGGMMSVGQGGGFGSGFLSGGISSGISSATSGMGAGAMIAAGGVSGGIGSVLGGGSFWDGLGQGLTVSALNHTAQHFLTHNFPEGESPFDFKELTLEAGEGVTPGWSKAWIYMRTGESLSGFDDTDVSSSGFSLGFGVGTPLNFSSSKGKIYFDDRHSGYSIKRVFSSTKFIRLRYGGSGIKVMYVEGLSSNRALLWHAHTIGAAIWAGGAGVTFPVNFR